MGIEQFTATCVLRTSSDPASPLSLSFYRAGDGRRVIPLNIYPKLKSKTLKLLRTYDDVTAIANAVARWSAAELHALSGDERQPAILAWVLAQQTRILLLDEPRPASTSGTPTHCSTSWTGCAPKTAPRSSPPCTT